MLLVRRGKCEIDWARQEHLVIIMMMTHTILSPTLLVFPINDHPRGHVTLSMSAEIRDSINHKLWSPTRIMRVIKVFQSGADVSPPLLLEGSAGR